MSSPCWLHAFDLTISTPERALICKPCRRVLRVNPRFVWQHLSTVHSADSSRRAQLEDLTKLGLPDGPQLAPRQDLSREDSALATVSGFSCGHCSTRTASQQLLWRHLSGHHRIGRLDATVGQDYRCVLLQQWTASGPSARQPWVV